MLPFRSIIPGIRESLTPPVERVTTVQRDRLRRVTFGPPRTYPPGDPQFVGPPSPVGPPRPSPVAPQMRPVAAPLQIPRGGQPVTDPYLPIEETGAAPFIGDRNLGAVRKPVPDTAIMQIAGARIPYAAQVSQAVRGGIEATAPIARVLPQTAIAQNLGERLPYVPTPSGVAGGVADALIPRYVWELGLELIPGIGTVPDLQRAVRAKTPEAVAAIRAALRDPRAQEAIAGARRAVTQGERGALTIGGEGDELTAPRGDVRPAADAPAETGEAAGGLPASAADNLPSPLVSTTGAVEELTPAQARAHRADPDMPPQPTQRRAVDEAPTIREIEARSKPLTPEQRSRIHRDTDRAFYQPEDFAESTQHATESAAGPVGGSLQKIQDVSAKIPIVKSIFGFLEPQAAARSQAKLGNVIPEAMVRRDLFIDGQKSSARAALFGWMERSRKTLGLNGKGIARDVGVKPGAEIPSGVRGRIDDIVEHPEDYVLSPEQEALIAEARHTFNAVTEKQLAAGVDVREVDGGYFPRVVTDSPKGEPKASGGRGFPSKPGHAKPREFTDLREGVAAGYKYANPIEAMQARLDMGIESIGNRRTLETIKPLGEKPSERVPQALRDEYLSAKEAYKPNRTPANEARLEQGKRALRVAATKANEPSIGEQKAFGRIFPKSVTDEIAKYTDISDPDAFSEFFRIQRATATSSDGSAAFIQGGNLFYRNNIAWWKSLGYSLTSLVKEPRGYVARNLDVIQQGIESGAISPPTEFQLQRGGFRASTIGRVPVIKQTQRAFEWMIFVGQTEWWKGASRIAKTDDERRELGAVIRKATGSMLRPGLTNKQRQIEPWTLFAGRFLMAVNATAADAARGGVRGAEARKTIGALLAGGTALTMAGQLATDGTLPNLTDPRDRDEPWMSVRRPGGSINVFGPLYPYIKAYASIAQNLTEGKPRDAGDDALFLGRTRLSYPVASIIDLIMGEDAVGKPMDGPRDVAEAQASKFAPISARTLAEDGTVGQREFPEGNLQLLGGRANRASEYRQKVNAAAPYIEQSNGDFRAAYQAALADENTDALDIVKSEWRKSLRPGIEALKFEIIDGARDEETGLARAPRIAFTAMEKKMLADQIWRDQINAAFKIDVRNAKTLSEVRKQYIDQRSIEYAKKASISVDEAKDALGSYFDANDTIKAYKKVVADARIIQWQKNPALFWDAVAVGWEEASEAEEKAIPRTTPQ